MIAAEYLDSPIPHYAGNPLIEALPPPLTKAHIYRRFLYLPTVTDAGLRLPPHIRRFCVNELFRLRQPLPIHAELGFLMDELQREGYVGRNPLVAGTLTHTQFCITQGSDGVPSPTPDQLSAKSAFCTGSSRNGKTMSELRIASRCFPQCIQHTSYQGRPLPELQVTWLYVRIPPNASLKEFVMAFGEALDLAVFGPGRDVYQEEMRRQSGNVISMLAAFRKRARQHHVGLLIVDELQFLSIGRAQGKRELSKFLHELVDRTGIPLLFSGTYKAYDMLLETVHETARVVGLGKIDFAPWARDAREWKLFVKTLWKYQWLQQAEPYTEDLAALMHDLVQGVMAFAVTLFVVAQWRAMATGKEKVTPDLLRSVMQNELSLLNGPIDKLREGTVESLMAYEDLLPAARKMQEILTNASQHIFAGRLQDIVRDELNKVAPNYDPTSSSVGAGAGTAKTGNAAEAQTADARSVPPASPDDLRHALDADNPLEVLEKFGVLDGEDAAVTGKIAA